MFRLYVPIRNRWILMFVSIGSQSSFASSGPSALTTLSQESSSSPKAIACSAMIASFDQLPEAQAIYRAFPNDPTRVLRFLVLAAPTSEVIKDSYVRLINQGASFFAPSSFPGEINAFTSLVAKRSLDRVLVLLKYGSPDKEYASKELLTHEDIKAGIKKTLLQMLEKDCFMKEFDIIVKELCRMPEVAFTSTDWAAIVAESDNINNVDQMKLAVLKERAEVYSAATSSFCSADTRKLCPEPRLSECSISRMYERAMKLADYTFLGKTFGLFCGWRFTTADDGSPVYQAGIFRKDGNDPHSTMLLLDAPDLTALAVLIESQLKEHYAPGLCTAGIKPISAQEIEQRLFGNENSSSASSSSSNTEDK